MNFKSYDDLATCLIKNMSKIPNDIDLILGIPRSGTMAGNMLALYCNLPFMDIYSFLRGETFHVGNTKAKNKIIGSPEEARHILLVDDSISTGRAMAEAKKLLRDADVKAKVTTFAVYGLSLTKGCADICLETCEQPRFFEWNFLHNWFLQYCCMDIDGVICEDPSIWQNDDGKNYRGFLLDAKPKLLPTKKVGTLVSCRLEKYREETESWLKAHNVEYDKLILLDGVTAEQRRTMVNHGAYKAEAYQKTDSVLFIESSYDEALEICRISGRPVFCIDNRQMITSDNVIKRIEVRQKELRVVVKQAIKKVLSGKRKGKTNTPCL